MATHNALVGDDVQFTVTYDGPETERGRMDAQVLGSAMLSLAQLIESSAGLTMGTTARVNVEIVADFRSGSFSFDAITVADLARQAKELLSQFTIQELMAMIGVTGGGGLFGIVRWLQNRKIQSIEPAPGNSARITTVDGDSTVVNAQTVVLLQNSTVRVHLDGVVAPLRSDGITEMRIGTGDSPPNVVRADEVGYFDPPPPSGDELQNKTSTEIVEVVSLNFTANRKWRFRLVDGTPFSSYLPDEFEKRVLAHEVTFGAGDALMAEMRTIVTREPAGALSAYRELVRVVDFIPAPKPQIELLPENPRRLKPPGSII